MRKRVYFCVTALWVSIILISVVTADQANAPRLFVTEKSFDFGQVDEGKPIEHAFKVSNRGDQPLKIDRVRPD